MANKKIQYVVDVDYGDLKQLGQAFTDAGRDAKTAFTGLTGALAKANADVNGLETALRGTTAAFNAVKAAGAGAFSDDEIVAYVQSLSRMGASFDEIVADADRVADSLKRATDVNMGKTVDGADQVADSMKRVGAESDNSRSVLANMAGNSAQTLSQLGGVVGDLGVGIGQLAEYAADGNISMSGLASIAGPMAALGAATMLVNAGMKGMSDVKAFDADRAKRFTEAIRQGDDAMTSLRNTVAETGQLMIAQNGAFGSFGGAIEDILPKLQQYGFTFSEVQRLITDPRALQGLIDYQAALQSGTKRSDYQQITQGLIDYTQATIDATERQNALNQFLDLTPDMLDDANQAFQQQQALAEQTGGAWQVLVDWMREGGAATEFSAHAMETLTEATGKSEAEILGIIDAKLNEQLDADAAAAEGTAKAFQEIHAAAQEAAAAYDQLVDVVNSADFDAAGFEAAGGALQDWFHTLAAGGGQNVQVISDYEEAFDNLIAGLREMKDQNLQDGIWGMVNGSTGTDEQRQRLDLLQQLGESVMPRITAVFEQGDGTLQSFAEGVSQVSDAIHGDLVRRFIELGDSEQEAEDHANAVQQRLGLIPENVVTMYKLMGDADASAKLQLIQGYINGLPASVQTEVTMDILADDPQAALAVVQSYIATHPPTANVGLNTGPAMTDYWMMAGAISGRTILAPVQLQLRNTLRQATGGIFGGFAPPSVVPGAAAPAAAALSIAPTAAVAVPAASPLVANVTINTAVVGNRFDTIRAVSDATRQAIRIAGRRHLNGGKR